MSTAVLIQSVLDFFKKKSFNIQWLHYQIDNEPFFIYVVYLKNVWHLLTKCLNLYFILK